MLFRSELLRVWEADTGVLAAALEARRRDTAAAAGLARLGRREEPLVRLVEAAQHLLLGVNRALGQPGGGRRVAPGREPLAHLGVAGVLLTAGVSCTLLGQRHVPDAPAHAGKAAKPCLDRGSSTQLESEGLDAHEEEISHEAETFQLARPDAGLGAILPALEDEACSAEWSDSDVPGLGTKARSVDGLHAFETDSSGFDPDHTGAL